MGADELVALGVVIRAQGVRGQLRVKLFNPDSELLLSCREATFRRAGVDQSIRFRETPRLHQGDVLVWPVDCNDRDRAEAWRGTEVCVPRSAFPALPAGEYYHRDLVGLAVRDRGGAEVGTVVRIETYPTVDVAVIQTALDELEIPIMDPYWVDADVQGGCVTVDHIDDLRALLSTRD